MSLQLTVCGARGSFPVFGREYEKFGQDTSCYVLRQGNYALILDCGSGLIGAQEVLAGCDTIDVLLSHIHYDHICGLFETPEVFKTANVTFYGNFDAWINTESEVKDHNPLFRIEELTMGRMRPVSRNIPYELGGGFSVTFLPSNHGDNTSMIEICRKDYRICFTGDYEHNSVSGIGVWVKGCDLLLFDGSYNNESYSLFKGWGHSKWEDGCRIAAENNVRHLVITHFAPQYDDAALEVQERRAKELFANTDFARQGSVYEI